MNTSCLDIYWNNDISIKHIIIHVYMYHVYIYIYISHDLDISFLGWQVNRWVRRTASWWNLPWVEAVEAPLTWMEIFSGEWQGEYPQIWNFIDTFWKTEWRLSYLVITTWPKWCFGEYTRCWNMYELLHSKWSRAKHTMHETFNLLPTIQIAFFQSAKSFFVVCGSIF